MSSFLLVPTPTTRVRYRGAAAKRTLFLLIWTDPSFSRFDAAGDGSAIDVRSESSLFSTSSSLSPSFVPTTYQDQIFNLCISTLVTPYLPTLYTPLDHAATLLSDLANPSLSRWESALSCSFNSLAPSLRVFPPSSSVLSLQIDDGRSSTSLEIHLVCTLPRHTKQHGPLKDEKRAAWRRGSSCCSWVPLVKLSSYLDFPRYLMRSTWNSR